MLEYLINYGIKQHKVEFNELDVVDKLQLQDQINRVRRDYYDLLNLLDEVQNQHINVTRQMSQRSKELLSLNAGGRTNAILNSDDEYLALEAEENALRSGLNMINNQLEFCKTDLRILQSVFYNRF